MIVLVRDKRRDWIWICCN